MPPIPRAATGPAKLRDAGLVALAAVLALLLNGYWYGIGDSELYIPLVEHAANPARFAGDYLFSEPTAGANFWVPAMGFLNRFAPTEILFFTGYLVALILLFAAILALCRVLFRDREDALFALAFLVTWKPLGGAMMRTIESIYTLRIAAMPFAVAFLAAWFGRKHKTAALLAAATFLIHPLSGVPLVLLLVAGLVLDRRSGRLRRLAGTSCLFALAVSPLVLKVLFSAGDPSGLAPFFFQADPLWLAVVRERLGYLFVSQWSRADLLLSAGYAGLLASALVFRRLSGVSGEKDRLAWALLAVCGALCLAAWVFGDLFPVAMVIELQLLRSLYLVIFTAMAFAGWMAGEGARIARKSAPGPGAALGTRTLSVLRRAFPLAMVVLLVGRPEAHYLAAVILAAGWGALYVDRLPVSLRRALGAMALFVAVLGLTGGKRVAPLEITLVLAAVFLFLPILRALARGRLAAPGPVGLVWITVTVLAVLTVGTDLWNGSFFHNVNLPGRVPGTSEVRTAEWCGANTPQDALFLVPPDFRGFRVFSGRPIVGNAKDGGPVVFSRAFMVQWLSRMEDLRGYEGFDAARFRALGKKYGATHVVAEGDRVPGLEPLATDGHYTVYRL